MPWTQLQCGLVGVARLGAALQSLREVGEQGPRLRVPRLQPHRSAAIFERRLGPEELIVTKTDLQGRITYANDVFLRVSAYSEEEILGRPHSIIPHSVGAAQKCTYRSPAT